MDLERDASFEGCMALSHEHSVDMLNTLMRQSTDINKEAQRNRDSATHVSNTTLPPVELYKTAVQQSHATERTRKCGVAEQEDKGMTNAQLTYTSEDMTDSNSSMLFDVRDNTTPVAQQGLSRLAATETAEHAGQQHVKGGSRAEKHSAHVQVQMYIYICMFIYIYTYIYIYIYIHIYIYAYTHM